MVNEERLESLRVDIDTRLTSLWLIATEPGTPLAEALQDEQVREAIGECFRCAYGQGYVDALQEDRAGRRAELQRTHGYRPE